MGLTLCSMGHAIKLSNMLIFKIKNSMIDVSINKKGTRVHTLNFCMNDVINFKVR